MRSLRECDIEVRMAVGRRIAGDGLEQAVFLDGELQRRFLQFVGKPFDARLTVIVGANLEVRIALAHESEFDLHVNLGVEDRLVGGVRDQEVCAARSNTGTDRRHVGGASGDGRGSRQIEKHRHQ